MSSSRARAAAAVAALGALAVLVGGAVFLAADDESDPPETTTSTSTTSTTVGADAAIGAIVEALLDDSEVPLTSTEASCIAGALVDVVDVEGLEALERSDAPLAELSPEERDGLIRGVVGCVPTPKAGELLGSPTTTTPPVELPDEGEGQDQ